MQTSESYSTKKSEDATQRIPTLDLIEARIFAEDIHNGDPAWKALARKIEKTMKAGGQGNEVSQVQAIQRLTDDIVNYPDNKGPAATEVVTQLTTLIDARLEAFGRKESHV